MFVKDWLNWIPLISPILPTLLIIAAILAGVWIGRRHMSGRLYLELGKRYDEIWQDGYDDQGFPIRLDLSRTYDPMPYRVKITLMRYLNLCCEEYVLYRRGLLHKRVWRLCHREIQRTLRTNLLRQGWTELRSAFLAYPDFVQDVDAAVQS